jgi:hypothetical protein
MTDRLRIEMDDLTLAELDQVAQLVPGEQLDEAMQGKGQFRAMAAIACVVRQRTDPTFTLEQALAMRLGEIELVEPDPEGASGDGTQQPSSRVPGSSIPATS